MLISIITDIHEDFRSLEKAMKIIDSLSCDLVVCLGDVTGYSPLFYRHQPDANACIDLLREKADVIIAGNHDLFTCGRLPSYHHEKNMPVNWYELSVVERIKIARDKIWLYLDEVIPDLSNENFSFLKELNEWEVVEDDNRKYLFTHFFQPDMAGIGRWFPFNSFEIREHFRFMSDLHCHIAFVGHKHPPAPIRVNRLFWSDPNEETMHLGKHHRAVICPAIVGERYISSFITFDTEKQTINTHQVF
jgi:predicted phosphodiesterase